MGLIWEELTEYKEATSSSGIPVFTWYSEALQDWILSEQLKEYMSPNLTKTSKAETPTSRVANKERRQEVRILQEAIAVWHGISPKNHKGKRR